MYVTRNGGKIKALIANNQKYSLQIIRVANNTHMIQLKKKFPIEIQLIHLLNHCHLHHL